MTKHCKVVYDGKNLPMEDPVRKLTEKICEVREGRAFSGNVTISFLNGTPIEATFPERLRLATKNSP